MADDTQHKSSMSEQTYKLYIIDFWVPFPSSEYGGLILVTATSDEDAIQCLRSTPFDCVYTENDKDGIEEAVQSAKRYELVQGGNYTTEVVKEFIT